MGHFRTATKGFTLLEVMIALAIAGLGLASLMAATGTGLGNAKLAGQYIEATRRAQSHLSLIGTAIPLIPGDRSGDDGGGFSWRVRISPPLIRTNAAPGAQSLPAFYTVEVIVSWQSAGTMKNVSLQSQRLGPVPGGDG